MKIKIYDYSKLKYQEEVDVVVMINQDGETAILNNHAPIILTAPKGFLRLERKGNKTLYVALEQAVLKALNNEVVVLSSFSEVSRSKNEALEVYQKAKAERLDITKKESVEISQLEKELKENIKKMKAGSI